MASYNYQGPEQFRPLSPWAYFGYSLLYSIPIVGFIMLIINSVNDSNINRRNFTRMYWCAYVLIAIVLIILVATGVFASLSFPKSSQSL